VRASPHIDEHGQQFFPMGVVLVVPVHDLHLPEVDGLAANVDVGDRLVIEPHPGFELALIRHLSPPMERRMFGG